MKNTKRDYKICNKLKTKKEQNLDCNKKINYLVNYIMAFNMAEMPAHLSAPRYNEQWNVLNPYTNTVYA